jgi:hypothetical protein
MTQRSELTHTANTIHDHLFPLFSLALSFAFPNQHHQTHYLCENQFSSIQYCLLPLPLLSLTDRLLPEPNAQNLYLSDVFHSLITNLFYVLFCVFVLYISNFVSDCISFSDVQCEFFFFISGQNFGRHFSFVDP